MLYNAHMMAVCVGTLQVFGRMATGTAATAPVSEPCPVLMVAITDSTAAVLCVPCGHVLCWACFCILHPTAHSPECELGCGLGGRAPRGPQAAWDTRGAPPCTCGTAQANHAFVARVPDPGTVSSP